MGAIFPTYAEPLCDLAAQLRALIDPASPKDTVFIAVRPEGTLFTTRREKAVAFGEADDAALGRLLGYPEAKAEVMAKPDDAVVLQVLDEGGAVIIEAAASRDRAAETLLAFAAFVPARGAIQWAHPLAVLGRRMLLNQEIGNAKS